MVERPRLILLNALPLNAVPLKRFCVDVKRIDPSVPSEFLGVLKVIFDKARSTNAEIMNFIRHEATVNLINQLFNLSLQVNPGLYQWKRGDDILVITLKKPIRGQESQTITLEDLDIFYVYIDEKCM